MDFFKNKDTVPPLATAAFDVCGRCQAAGWVSRVFKMLSSRLVSPPLSPKTSTPHAPACNPNRRLIEPG